MKDGDVDFKLELILLPVTDVDRSKQFYQEKMGSSWTSIISQTMTFAWCNSRRRAQRARSPSERA